MEAKIEREKVVPYDFVSKMRDVPAFSKRLKFLRLTPEIQQDIDATVCELLAGRKAVSDTILFRTEANAIVMTAVKLVGNEDDITWIKEIMDPAMVYDIRLKWQEYQNSFYGPADDPGVPAKA